MSVFNITQSLSNINANIQNAFGLNSWQLKRGKYNGCTFAAFTPSLLNNNIPIISQNPITGAAANVVAVYNQIFGTGQGAADPNRDGQLYDSILGYLQFDDRVITGTVEKETPYTNSINIEDTGFKGYRFAMTLLFLGPDYLRALNNFENAIANPPSDPSQYLVLEHPTRGVINGYTYVVGEPTITHSDAHWRGATVKIMFRATLYDKKQLKGAQFSTVQKVANAISAGLGAVTSIKAGITSLNSFANSNLRIPLTYQSRAYNAPILTIQNAQITTTQSAQLNTILTNISNTLLNCMAYVYQKGKPGVSNPQLDKTIIDYNYLPPALNQSPVYNLNQGSIILDYYYNLCLININIIKSYNLNGETNDIIITINNSVSKLSDICTSIGDKTTFNTFITPYNMSIRKVLSLNNISVSNVNVVMSLNPQIQSANYILAGTLVNLL